MNNLIIIFSSLGLVSGKCTLIRWMRRFRPKLIYRLFNLGPGRGCHNCNLAFEYWGLSYSYKAVFRSSQRNSSTDNYSLKMKLYSKKHLLLEHKCMTLFAGRPLECYFDEQAAIVNMIHTAAILRVHSRVRSRVCSGVCIHIHYHTVRVKSRRPFLLHDVLQRRVLITNKHRRRNCDSWI